MNPRTLKALSAAFVVTYDLRDPDAWRRAHEHRRLWGKLYTDYFVLDDHVLRVFRSGGPQWERWEWARKRVILRERAEGAA